MNRRRHHDPEESSLELLLDTMCNTFGGVMFIAISLFIIISAFPPDAATRDAAPPVEIDPVKLREEVENLRALLEAKHQELELLAEKLRREQESPLQRMRQELVLTERMIREAELARRSRALLLEAERRELQKLTGQITEIEEKMRTAEQRKNELETAIMRLEQKLAELKTRPAERVSMEFKVMEPSKKRPFFIILDGTDAWPVGPWRDASGEDHPDEAVESRQYSADGHRVVSCRIMPGKGLPVLTGNEMSAGFQDLLRRIPKDQVPKFFIHPSAAATISRLREILKRNNVLHGCIPAEEDAQEFIYNYQKVVRYEY